VFTEFEEDRIPSTGQWITLQTRWVVQVSSVTAAPT